AKGGQEIASGPVEVSLREQGLSVEAPRLGGPRDETFRPARIARGSGRPVGIERHARGGKGLVPGESPERDESQQDGGAKPGRPCVPAEGRPRFALGQDQQRNRAAKSGERDGGQL